MNSPLDVILLHPPYNGVISREAKQLRTEVFELVSSVAPGGINFIRSFNDRYNQVYFEKAILFHHYENIVDAIYRRTSSKYLKDGRGTSSKRSSRDKKFDWGKLLTFDDHTLYTDTIEGKNPHFHVDPRKFDHSFTQFSDMYYLFINWFISDFSRSDLYKIYNYANKYSCDFVKTCMDKIADPRARNIKYLDAVIENEFAILRMELEESKEINEFSKSAIQTIIDATGCHESVDWDDLTNQTNIKQDTEEAFDKVKLS